MTTATLNRTFAALADPTRRAMLARLSRGSATVNELAEPFDLRLPTISKHLKVLEQAQLIERGRRAQWRPCVLRPEPLLEAREWVEQMRQVWEANYARLDEVLGELAAQPPATAHKGRKLRGARKADERNR